MTAKSFPKPLHASKHCRHYSYDYEPNDGPACAKGIDLTSKPGAALVCMPNSFGKICAQREEFTEEERAVWKEYQQAAMMRMILVMPEIPSSDNYKEDQQYWGKTGRFTCPACEGGNVRWTRSPSNGHIWAACSTPNCFSVMQ
jgi:hypothetical protein